MVAQYTVKKTVFIIFNILVMFACAPSEYRSMPELSGKDIEEFKTVDGQPRITNLRTRIPQYALGIGDEVKIMIYDNPKDSTKATELGEVLGHEINEDGEINIPLLKHITIAGMTRKEASKKLEDLYSKYIKRPHVMLDIVKYNSKFYYVTGSVQDPGKYPVKIKTNLLEAVTKIVPYVRDSFVQTIYMKRGENIYPVNLSELGKSREDFSEVYLADGDTFYVPPPAANRAYILGEVVRPGAYPLSGGSFSLIDLISEAGGVDPISGRKGKIYLIRKLGGEFRVATIPFDKLYSGKMAPIKLLPGDRILVTPTPMTSYNRIIQKILPTFQLINSGTSIYNNLK